MLIRGLRPVPLRSLVAVPMRALALWLGTLSGIGDRGSVIGFARTAPSQIGSAQFDCSRIKELGIDRQMNAHAAQIMLQCRGQGPAAYGPKSVRAVREPPLQSPKSRPGDFGLWTLDFGLTMGLDVDSITGLETYPNVTQAGSFLWAEGNTVVVNYNDSSVAAPPSNSFTGISYSTNGGATFTRSLPAPFVSGHGTNYGDPIVVYNRRLGAWFAGDVVSGCGGQG